MSKERWIFWDWNGTLLDDAEYSFNNVNMILKGRGKPLLPDLEYYRSIFCFPVSEYYVKAGIEPERFTVDGQAWMDAYVANEAVCPLRSQVKESLEKLSRHNIHQVILSASKVDFLTMQIVERGIRPYFEDILGLTHIWATSKIEIGREFLQQHGIDPACACMIGDTLHDAEVAKALGTACVLSEGGHQLRRVLETAGVPVAPDIASAVDTALSLLG